MVDVCCVLIHNISVLRFVAPVSFVSRVISNPLSHDLKQKADTFEVITSGMSSLQVIPQCVLLLFETPSLRLAIGYAHNMQANQVPRHHPSATNN